MPGRCLPLAVRLAKPGADLRAAAYLRASTFYPVYGASQTQKTHLRNQAAITWHTLESRVAGKDKEYSLLRVFPLVATVERWPEGSVNPDTARLIARLFEELSDRSMQLPGDQMGQEQLVLGCLDLCIGPRLPSESLVGRWPLTGDRRAYLTNVCVTPGARRRGVAQELMRAALTIGAAEGIQHTYVHVQASNVAAISLYRDRCGFREEQREPGSHPSRHLLLHNEIPLS